MKIETFDASTALRYALRPREHISVSAWADRHRVLTKESGASEPGPWRTSRIPYAKDIMDAFGDPAIREIDVIKSARVGMTECGNNMLAYAVDQEPGPCMYVYPDESSAKDECRSRLRPMVEQSPRLREHIPHAGWASQVELDLGRSARVVMAWASSPTTLIRRTFRYVFVDEIDNCQRQAGALGDIVTLARQRTLTYGARAKLVLYTSPTIATAPGWLRWESCPDRRWYHVPCPLCGAYQVLSFDRIKIPPDMRDPETIELDRLGRYQCVACQGMIDYSAERGQRWMVARGVWLSEGMTPVEKLPLADAEAVECAVFDHPFRWTPRVEGEKPRSRRVAFHVWSAYSPWVTWSSIIADFLRAKDDREQLRVFSNQVLGEPWRETAEDIRVESVRKLGESAMNERDLVPAKALVVILGVDVQKDCLYYIVRAWGPDRESWLVREGMCTTFDELYQRSIVEYDVDDDEPRTIHASYAAIDSRYRGDEVYDFARKYHGVYPMTGVDHGRFPIYPRPIQYVSKQHKTQETITGYVVDSGYYTGMLYRMIRQADDEFGGRWHLYRGVSEEYCQQVTAEHQVWKTAKKNHRKQRVLVWEPRTANARNHFLDCEKMALALADHKGILSLRESNQSDQSKPLPPSRQNGESRSGYRIRRYR